MQLAGRSSHAIAPTQRSARRTEHAWALIRPRPDGVCSQHGVGPMPAATTSAPQGRARASATVVSVQSPGSNGQPLSQSGMMAGQGGMQSGGGGGALVRRPSLAPAPPLQQQQMVYVDMSQVVGKQVITTSTGRDLGVVSCMWVDPARGEVVSLDLDDKKGVGAQRIANIYLSRLTQIGDVVLVQDESVLYDQPLDGRYGFVVLAGMEVRSRNGDFLGKVRDFAFSPDTGALSKITYDDFGLSFLPVNFFDTYSLNMSDVLALGPAAVSVADDAKYRERRETSGLFAAIPSLLRSLNSGSSSGRAPAGLLGAGSSDPYRQDGYLPQGYSYEQWERDVQRWEQETGLSYEQYVRSQSGGRRQLPAASSQRPALPSRVSEPSSSYSPSMPPQQQQQQQQQGSGWGGVQRPQWQQPAQPAAYPSQPQPQRPMQPRPQQPVDMRYRGASLQPPAASPYTGAGAPAAGRPGVRAQPLQRPQAPQSGTAPQPMAQRPGMAPQQQGPRQAPASPGTSNGPDASAAAAAVPLPSDPATRRRMDEYVVQERVREEEMVDPALPAGWTDGGAPRQASYRQPGGGY